MATIESIHYDQSEQVIGLDGLPVPPGAPVKAWRVAADYPEYAMNNHWDQLAEMPDYEAVKPDFSYMKAELLGHCLKHIRDLRSGMYNDRWSPETYRLHVATEIKDMRREYRNLAWRSEDKPEDVAYVEDKFIKLQINEETRPVTDERTDAVGAAAYTQ